MRRPLSHLILLVAAVCGTAVFARAQTTADVTLNVVLTNASAITFASGAAGESATLTYATAADYNNGVSLDQPAAFSVTSNQPYSVTVVAASDLANGSNNIPVGDVTVAPVTSGGAVTGVTTDPATAVPTGSAAQIITTSVGSALQSFDLTYAIASSHTPDILGKPAGTYTTTLTYTLTNP